MGTSSARYDITICPGTTFRLPLNWKDETDATRDLLLWEARMEIRPEHGSDTVIILFSSSPGASDGTITLSDTSPNIILTASDTLTYGLLDYAPGEGVYDLKLKSSGGEVTKLLRGDVCFEESVTSPFP